MPHIIAQLYQEQRALRAEAASIFEAAEAASSGAMTDDQSARFEAIRARSSRLESLIDDAVAALDSAPGASDARARGFEAGRAKAHAEIVALLEVCAARNAKPSVILGFLKARTSAADAHAALAGGSEAGTELISRAGFHSPDTPASWDGVIAKVNRDFGQ